MTVDKRRGDSLIYLKDVIHSNEIQSAVTDNPLQDTRGDLLGKTSETRIIEQFAL